MHRAAAAAAVVGNLGTEGELGASSSMLKLLTRGRHRNKGGTFTPLQKSFGETHARGGEVAGCSALRLTKTPNDRSVAESVVTFTAKSSCRGYRG